MKVKLMIAASLLMASSVVWSQMTPQMQQQVPPSDPSSSQYHSVYLPAHGVGDTIQPNSKERWEDRWGAIATDDGGTFGIVTDLTSKSAAQKAALSECRNRGGGNCKVARAYYNQCAVVIAGRTGVNITNAATEEEANSIGIRSCEAKDGDGSCRVYYSGCSLPVRVQ